MPRAAKLDVRRYLAPTIIENASPAAIMRELKQACQSVTLPPLFNPG
jgi:hypothetical protein